MMLLFLALIIILFVIDSHVVLSGATYGLLLWYKNVVPILLPFMLLSGLFVNHAVSNSGNIFCQTKTYGILTTIFLGLFCGYPLGAKTAADFYSSGIYSKNTATFLLPLCNNASPMFISGYVIHTILQDTISFPKTLIFIYAPYIIIFILISLLYIFIKHFQNYSFNDNSISSAYCKSKNAHITTASKTNQVYSCTNDYMLSAVIQITLVGIYIMICSIIIEFITEIPFISQKLKVYVSAFTEITRGIISIKDYIPDTKEMTALILATTSFGGLSSILQTKMVIADKGLSIIPYILTKLICAIGTYYLVYLFI